MKLYPKKMTTQVSTKSFATLQKRAYEMKITVGELVRIIIDKYNEKQQQ